MDRERIIKKIQDEFIDYIGVINFASKGITGDPQMLWSAFRYGLKVGVECTKMVVIRIIREEEVK